MTTPAQETTPAASSSPTSTPDSPTPLRVPRLGIRHPSPTPSTPTPGAEPGSPSGSASADAPPPSDPLDTDTGTRSSADQPGPDAVPLKFGKGELRAPLRGAVLTAATVLHKALARNEYEVRAGVWLMDGEDEAAPIADPLAAIAQRRAGGSVFEPDVADLIKAGLAAAGYIAKNVVKTWQIRTALRRARAAGMTDAQPEEGAAA